MKYNDFNKLYQDSILPIDHSQLLLSLLTNLIDRRFDITKLNDIQIENEVPLVNINDDSRLYLSRILSLYQKKDINFEKISLNLIQFFNNSKQIYNTSNKFFYNYTTYQTAKNIFEKYDSLTFIRTLFNNKITSDNSLYQNLILETILTRLFNKRDYLFNIPITENKNSFKNLISITSLKDYIYYILGILEPSAYYDDILDAELQIQIDTINSMFNDYIDNSFKYTFFLSIRNSIIDITKQYIIHQAISDNIIGNYINDDTYFQNRETDFYSLLKDKISNTELYNIESLIFFNNMFCEEPVFFINNFKHTFHNYFQDDKFLNILELSPGDINLLNSNITLTNTFIDYINSLDVHQIIIDNNIVDIAVKKELLKHCWKFFESDIFTSYFSSNIITSLINKLNLRYKYSNEEIITAAINIKYFMKIGSMHYLSIIPITYVNDYENQLVNTLSLNYEYDLTGLFPANSIDYNFQIERLNHVYLQYFIKDFTESLISDYMLN